VSGCGAGPATVASGQGFPAFLAIDSSNVYWTNHGDGTVDECKGGTTTECGFNPTVLSTCQGDQRGIAVANGYVYWATAGCTSAGSIMKCAVDTCDNQSTNLVLNLTAVDLVAVDATSTYVYWTQKRVTPVARCSTGGCDEGSTATGFPSSPLAGPAQDTTGIAVDRTNVYWADSEAVWQCALEPPCTSALMLASHAGASSVAVDSKNVYWVNRGDSMGSLMAVPIGGGGGAVVVASNQYYPGPLALDSSCVYWTTSSTDEDAGAVMKVAKP
jgi:hypothetical protein